MFVLSQFSQFRERLSEARRFIEQHTFDWTI